MTTVSDVLHVAHANIGYEEHPRGSNNSKFGAWFGINPAPWCAMFVSYCFFAAGHPLKISGAKGFSYCPNGVAYAQNNHLWDSDGRYLPGDIIFFNWDGGRVDHTGIVVSDNGSTIMTIEGNTGDLSQNNGGAVMLRQRAHSHEVVGVMKMSQVLAGGSPTPRPTPQSVAPPWPGRTLNLSSPLMHGNDVATWQNKMRSRGWKAIQVDGTYGPVSAKVCGQFQAQKSLLVDGTVGPVTWHATWMTG